jgi:uncharacterized membrane protein YGL010W
VSAIVKHLSNYAEYHRDRRNVATHMFGIPLIVLAVEVLLSRPQWHAGPLLVSPAMLLAAMAVIFYIRLDIILGAAMAVFLGLGLWIGLALAAMATSIWLGVGAGGFAVGWILQFIGHGIEGRKPAFLDDLKSLLIGPIFVMAEFAFAIGFRNDLKKQMNTGHKLI